MKHHPVVFMAVAAALTLVSCKHSPPASVAAQVNGHSITYAELDRYYQTQQQQVPEGSSEDLVMAQKLELLNSLITNEIMLQRAEKMGLSAVDADVDTELNKMKAPYTKEDFEKQLAARHMTVDDLRAQLRRELTVNKLINKEITSHIAITDADVKAFYDANKASFNLPEPQVHIAQILVTPFPDPNVRNLKNSKAQNETEAKTKIRRPGRPAAARRRLQHARAELFGRPRHRAQRRRYGVHSGFQPRQGRTGPQDSSIPCSPAGCHRHSGRRTASAF